MFLSGFIPQSMGHSVRSLRDHWECPVARRPVLPQRYRGRHLTQTPCWRCRVTPASAGIFLSFLHCCSLYSEVHVLFFLTLPLHFCICILPIHRPQSAPMLKLWRSQLVISATHPVEVTRGSLTDRGLTARQRPVPIAVGGWLRPNGDYQGLSRAAAA